MKAKWHYFVVLAMVLSCAGLIYYVNGVYLPNQKAEAAQAALLQQQQEQAKLEQEKKEENSYDYTIKDIPVIDSMPSISQPAANTSEADKPGSANMSSGEITNRAVISAR